MKAKKQSLKSPKGFTEEERAAAQARIQELKSEATRGKKNNGESDLLAAIAKMPSPDRTLAERINAIVKAAAPSLSPKTWYGMPAYANPAGNVVCFFQSAHKFKTRYATFGLTDKANLDEGDAWPVAFALKQLTAADEAKLAALVKKAVSEKRATNMSVTV